MYTADKDKCEDKRTNGLGLGRDRREPCIRLAYCVENLPSAFSNELVREKERLNEIARRLT